MLSDHAITKIYFWLQLFQITKFENISIDYTNNFHYEIVAFYVKGHNRILTKDKQYKKDIVLDKRENLHNIEKDIVIG